jgi:hypothetical protein
MRDLVKMAINRDNGAILGGIVAVIAVAEVAFVFGLITRPRWQACILVVLVATTLAAGVVFTVLEMQRLAKEGRYTGGVRGNPKGDNGTVGGLRPV